MYHAVWMPAFAGMTTGVDALLLVIPATTWLRERWQLAAYCRFEPARLCGMHIDIDRLGEAELVDLNHRVVARLKFMREMRAHAQMLDFRIGQRVVFQPDGYPELTGVITKYNRKTVTVIVENGQQWRVAPGLLRQAGPPAAEAAEPASVLRLQQK